MVPRLLIRRRGTSSTSTRSPLRRRSPRFTSSSSAGQGLDWLQQMVDACGGGCFFDYINLHWYGPDFVTFQGYIELAHAKFPVSPTCRVGRTSSEYAYAGLRATTLPTIELQDRDFRVRPPEPCLGPVCSVRDASFVSLRVTAHAHGLLTGTGSTSSSRRFRTSISRALSNSTSPSSRRHLRSCRSMTQTRHPSSVSGRACIPKTASRPPSETSCTNLNYLIAEQSRAEVPLSDGGTCPAFGIALTRTSDTSWMDRFPFSRMTLLITAL